MNLNDPKIVVAIENAVCEQLEASGIKADPFRLDGEKIIDVILQQLKGFVLVPEDQAKDTERLNYLLGDNRYIRTVVKRDKVDEDYNKLGEHYLFTEVYWIDGWDYNENSSSDTERGAIDKAIVEEQQKETSQKDGQGDSHD